MKKKLMAIAAASALVLAACGGDDEATEETVAEVTEDTMAEEAMPAEAGDIVAVASGNPDFSTLVAAIQAAGLVETLQGAGPFTVFAPTNAAFEALPAGLLEKLLLPENVAVLTAILTYHVVSGQVMSTDVTVRFGTAAGTPHTSSRKDNCSYASSRRSVSSSVTVKSGSSMASR
ncbi:MAG: fasciclin domain-containing protein [Actinobacteria bacterium]|nr:fasciclin domain-containing protein [Actinomycetota bacterium]